MAIVYFIIVTLVVITLHSLALPDSCTRGKESGKHQHTKPVLSMWAGLSHKWVGLSHRLNHIAAAMAS